VDATVAQVTSSEAVQLFVERATEADAHFGLTATDVPYVSQICRQLEGLPLAIELAAARVSVLTVQQIADLLSDPLRLLVRAGTGQPARHLAMRATLDWSTAMLQPLERKLFWRLSVFAGSWDLEAAQAVCADERVSAADVSVGLARLV